MRLAARCGLRGSALRVTGMVAGRRRYPRSPALARGRATEARGPAPHQHRPCHALGRGDREWGLRPQAPPPPCRHQRWPAVTKASVVVGQVVRVCDRRPHSRSPWREQAAGVVDEVARCVPRWSPASEGRRAHTRTACPRANRTRSLRERRSRAASNLPTSAVSCVAGRAKRGGATELSRLRCALHRRFASAAQRSAPGCSARSRRAGPWRSPGSFSNWSAGSGRLNR